MLSWEALWRGSSQNVAEATGIVRISAVRWQVGAALAVVAISVGMVAASRQLGHLIDEVRPTGIVDDLAGYNAMSDTTSE